MSGGSGGTAGGGAGGANAGGVPGGADSGASGSGPGPDAAPLPTTHFVYVGSGDFSGSDVGAITVYRFDPENGELTYASEVAAGGLASFLATDAAHRTLYAVDEAKGALVSYAIDPMTGALSFLNQVETAGNAVYVTVDSSDGYALTAHYNQGQVEVTALAADHTLGASQGARSTGAQAHSIVLSPDNRYAFVPNKGDDSISQFTFDEATGALAANTPAKVQAAGGAGPRHMAFHPNGRVAYVINELNSTLTSYSYAAASGVLTPLDSVSTLPVGFAGGSAAADVHVSPDGRFVYGSNRVDGQDGSIAIFTVETDGTVSLVGHESSRGRTPRNFDIAPSGDFLLVGNQESGEIVRFRVDKQTGRLTFLGEVSVGKSPFFVGLVALVP